MIKKNKEKILLGLVEKVKLKGEKAIEVLAKIDTGAESNSIDSELAARLRAPVVKISRVVSSHGKSLRPVVELSLIMQGKRFKAKFNIIDRKNLKYKVLIGQSVLKKGFLIDPNKK